LTNKKLKIALIEKDMSVIDLARETGYTATHISGVISGRTKSQRAEKLISFVLGTPQHELFVRKND